jgi:hypothetical protein
VTDANNVPFTITSLNRFTGIKPDVVWTVGTIPNYIWAKIDPYGKDGANLPQSTMFYLFTATTFFKGLVAVPNYTKQFLINAGYSLT